jgi:hypothetical protein
MLHPAGEVWWALPRSESGLVQKTVWWSRHFHVQDEPEPAISVSGRRLDIAGQSFRSNGLGTNASTGMLQGIDIPTAGCWEITGNYRDVTLAYTVWVSAE